MTDYKNFRARPKINKDRVASFLLAILLVIALAVRFEPASAEPKFPVLTYAYDCAPTMEMNMPIEVRP